MRVFVGLVARAAWYGVVPVEEIPLLHSLDSHASMLTCICAIIIWSWSRFPISY